jgi:hypothetical protein
MSCSYQTITLSAGEQFVLPPGAELIYVSDPNSVTSDNDCAKLNQLEDVECYATILGEAGEGAGSDTVVYDVVQITGLRVNNILYNFTTPFDVGDTQAALRACLDSTSFGPIIIDLATGGAGTINRGVVAYVVFKTLPSIANDLYFVGNGTGHVSGDGGGTTPNVPVEFRVITYSEATSLPSGAEPATWPECTIA